MRFSLALATTQPRDIKTPFAIFILTCLSLFASTPIAKADVTTSHGYSYFADLKLPADFKNLAYVNPNAPKGGEIITSVSSGTFDSFNPYARKGTPGSNASINIERLMTSTADEIGAIYGLIAKTLTYPDDLSWVIFDLRPEAKFADGSAVTAEDVVFTFDLTMEQALISYREGVKRVIAKAEVLGPHQVKFTFQPDAPKRERIYQAANSPVMSKTWFEKTGARLDESRLEPTLGTGPYMLDSFEINERITYKRNPDYWGNDLPINAGRHNFDKIRIEYFADTDAAFEGFKSGAFTFRQETSSKQWATGYDFPNLAQGHVVKKSLKDGAQASGQAFVMNLRRDKFQDIRVREAISLMFNFDWANEALFFGLYQRVNGFAANSYLEAKGMPSPQELALLEPLKDHLPATALGSAVMAPTSSSKQFDRKNARKASKLLEQAGWTVSGDDGMRTDAEGNKLAVEFLSYSVSFDRVILPYVENLRKIGIDASLNRVDTAQFIDRRYGFDYDIITDHLALGYEPGGGLSQMFGSKDAQESVFNSAGLANEGIDILIDTIRAAKNKEDLVTGVKALDRALRSLHFAVPQWYSGKYLVAYYDQFEHPEILPPYAYGSLRPWWFLDFWWFNAEKAAKLKAANVLN